MNQFVRFQVGRDQWLGRVEARVQTVTHAQIRGNFGSTASMVFAPH
jgi:hypothetical protein